MTDNWWQFLTALWFGMWLSASHAIDDFRDGYNGRTTIRLELRCDDGHRHECEQIRDAAIVEAHRLGQFKVVGQQ